MVPRISATAKDAIVNTMLVTGYPIALARDPNLDVWSNVRVPRGGDEFSLISYRPDKEKYLDYLIAHECGHLYRIFSAPPGDRLVPMTDRQRIQRAREEVGRERWSGKTKIPTQYLSEAIEWMCHGMLQQLLNAPADCRIERWIYDQLPRLRDVQAAALLELNRTFEACLDGEVKRELPRSMYTRSNTLNYVLAKTDSQILGDSSFLDPFLTKGFDKVGERLYDSLQSQDDEHAGDIRATNAWAQELGMRDWYDWTVLR